MRYIALLSVVATCVSHLSAAVFIPLGDLSGGELHSEATRISADGSTVIGWGTSAGGREAFRWTIDGGMVGLGHLPNGSQDSIAYGISGDGSLIAGFSDNQSKSGLQAEGFYWTEAEGMQPMGFLPGGAESRARAVSQDGSTIVGWSRTSAGIEAFRWNRAQAMTALGDLEFGAVGSAAQGVSADGSYVVGYGTYGGGRQAVYWTDDGIHNFAGPLGVAWEVDPDDSAIGEITHYFTSEPERQAVVFHESDFFYEPLGDLPGGAVDSAAYGLVRSGSPNVLPLYVVGTGSTDAGYESFIWSEWFGTKSFKEIAERNFGLDLSGWHLTTSVSAATTERTDMSKLKNAVFVGTGIDPQGNTQAWLIDFGRTQTATLDDAPGWLEAPRGVFDSVSTERFEITNSDVPLNADLWSPPFTIPEGSTPRVEFSYLWQSKDGEFGGNLFVEVVADDNPTAPSAFSRSAPFAEEKTLFSDTVPVTGVVPNKKYRVRFRYFDQDEKQLSLGPLSIDKIVIEGVNFNFEVPGDTNDDGVVDIEDLNNVRNNFGGLGIGDANGDSVVNIEDLNLVRNNFGLQDSIEAVPEPAALHMVVAVGAALIACGLPRRFRRWIRGHR